MQYHYGQPSPFPPSFEGNPWAYGFGLFGDVAAGALALAMLLTYLFEARRFRQINALIDNQINQPPVPPWSAFYIYRAFNISMLTFVVMRAAPDALWMLAWGEVSEASIRILLAIDLWSDGLALIPFGYAILFWTWGRQVIPQKLLIGSGAGAQRPDWTLIWKNGRIVLVVLLIAIGVTIGKASA